METVELLNRIESVVDASQSLRELYDARLAPNFAFFGHEVVDEMYLSRMLGTLLDPRGSHAQGGVFLRLFLETIGLNWPDTVCASATVAAELAFDNGRLDLFVRSGDYALAIENKPWAASPDGQIERYLNFMDSLAVNERGVVFLSPLGTPPPENSLASDKVESAIEHRKLCLMSYEGDIVEWLESCRRHCQADRVAMWIDEFRRMIEGLFRGSEDDPMQDHIVNVAIATEGSVNATMEILAAQNVIREKLFKRLGSQLENLVQNKGWEVNFKGNPYSKYYGIEIVYEKMKPKFGLEFQGKQYAELVFGVMRVTENVPPAGTLRGLLETTLGAGAENEWWMWKRYAGPHEAMCPVEPSWSQATDPWVKIADGSLAAILVNSAERIYALINEL